MRRREIEIRDLRNFQAVAETLHFGRAASKLGIAQPNLSQQIMQLESMLGHALFERTSRGVALTAPGEFFQRRTEALLMNLKDAVETTQRVGQGSEGDLIVGFSGSVMFSRVSSVIEHFRRTHPKVALQLRELHANEQVSQLLDGTLDISIIRDGQPTAGLTMRTLSQEPYIAILPERHPLALRKRLPPSSLRDEKFVLFSPRMAKLAYERTVGLCLAEGFSPDIVQEAPQWATVVNLVAAGMGVSLAPRCISQLTIPGVVYRPIQSKHWTSIDVGARTEQKNPAAKILQSYAQREFGTVPIRHV